MSLGAFLGPASACFWRGVRGAGGLWRWGWGFSSSWWFLSCWVGGWSCLRGVSTGSLSGLGLWGNSWLVVQEPVPGQWYDEAVATFIHQLKDEIYELGDVKYV